MRKGDFENFDIVDSHAIVDSIAALPTQGDAGTAVGYSTQENSIAAIAAASLGCHVGYSDESIVSVKITHGEGSLINGLETIVEGDGKLLRRLAETWQCN